MFSEPTPQKIAARVREFDTSTRYKLADLTIERIFGEWPANSDLDVVLAKVAVLNSLYFTNIYDVYTVARHIVDVQIDERLASGDPQLVNDIAAVDFAGKRRVNLSFASKYCSWHQPDLFQIYDSYVDGILWAYRKHFSFARFHRKDLRIYPQFLEIVKQFCERFDLEGISRRDVDKFLWVEGRKLAQSS